MRLVNADAIPYKRDIAVTERFSKFGAFNGKIVYNVTKEEIDAMPTVDAVPVVRCKDCRWRKDNSVATAWMPCRALVTPDDFSCVVGERKDGDVNG